jgi:hypothetical protein
MEVTLLRSDFCEFPWPAKVSWSFESTQYGDSKSLVLSSRGRIVHGMIQVWDLNGNDLRTFHDMQWKRMSSAPQGFPPGVTIERIKTDGQFGEWIGVSNIANPDRFLDYELMSRNQNTIVYLRRGSQTPRTLDIQRELSMIVIRDPSLWVVDAVLHRVGTPNTG